MNTTRRSFLTALAALFGSPLPKAKAAAAPLGAVCIYQRRDDLPTVHIDTHIGLPFTPNGGDLNITFDENRILELWPTKPDEAS